MGWASRARQRLLSEQKLSQLDLERGEWEGMKIKEEELLSLPVYPPEGSKRLVTMLAVAGIVTHPHIWYVPHYRGNPWLKR